MLNGSKLQYLRRLKGYSQVYIAECIGVSERWIGKVENDNDAISQETYDKWILALYGGLKPVKKEKVQPTKVANEKKTVKKTTKKKS